MSTYTVFIGHQYWGSNPSLLRHRSFHVFSPLFYQTPPVTLTASTSFLSLWFSDCRSFIRCSAWPSCASSSASSSLLPSWNSSSSSRASWQLQADRRDIRQQVETEGGRCSNFTHFLSLFHLTTGAPTQILFHKLKPDVHNFCYLWCKVGGLENLYNSEAKVWLLFEDLCYFAE